MASKKRKLTNKQILKKVKRFIINNDPDVIVSVAAHTIVAQALNIINKKYLITPIKVKKGKRE